MVVTIPNRSNQALRLFDQPSRMNFIAGPSGLQNIGYLYVVQSRGAFGQL